MSRLCLWLLLLATTLPLGASADVRHPGLHWTRGPGAASCIEPRALANAVEALTGPVFVGPRESDYSVEGHIEARPAGGFVLRLSVSSLDGALRGMRLLEHLEADCRSFDGAIVFMIALTVDPDLALERSLPASGLLEHAPADVLLGELIERPAVPARIEPVASVLEAVKPAALAPASPALRARPWAASLGATALAGELPEVGLGAIAGASLPLGGWFSLAAQLRASTMVHATRLDRTHRLRAQALALALSACARTPPSSGVTLTWCVGPEPAVLRARGLDYSRSQVAYLSIWGLTARLELSYRVKPRLSLSLSGLLRANLQQKQLVSEDPFGERTVYGFGAVSGGLAFGLIRHFGSGQGRARGTDAQHKERP